MTNWLDKILSKAKEAGAKLTHSFKKKTIENADLWSSCPECKKKSINFIQLVAPTTSNIRLKKIIKDSHDMVYYISMLSTTGGKLKVAPKTILKNYEKIKRINKNKNVVIGFGITEKTISSLKQADGLVVGSALCKSISDAVNKRKNPAIAAQKTVKKLKAKIL